ncbi:MAG: aldo/keto reductase [Euryarchaeota archaeon]|nr:aldo/keto reductase [Euryarchaeota archaeon]
MRTRDVGKSGLKVSEVGFGTWGMGDSYGPVDDEESRASLRLGFENGIIFYDTADLYGDGRSERLIGEALGDVRDEIVISSKTGYLSHDGHQLFTPAHILKSLDASLNRLGTDHLDIYMLHSPPVDLLVKEPAILDTMRDLKDHGKITAFGISARSPEDAALAIAKTDLDVMEINLNLIDQRSRRSGLFEAACQAGVGLIARTPLAFGFLTGRYGPNATFPNDDHRSFWPRDQIRIWAEAPKKFEEIANARGCSITQLALLYCISDPAVASVIPGMLTAKEVHENVAAGGLPALSPKELEQIERIYDNNTFFVGGRRRRNADDN